MARKHLAAIQQFVNDNRKRLAIAFEHGLAESVGDVGRTYDNDPESAESRAYDYGRTLGRQIAGLEPAEGANE